MYLFRRSLRKLKRKSWNKISLLFPIGGRIKILDFARRAHGDKREKKGIKKGKKAGKSERS
jgi:hypothetical protein